MNTTQQFITVYSAVATIWTQHSTIYNYIQCSSHYEHHTAQFITVYRAVATIWTPHSTIYNFIQRSSHTINTTPQFIIVYSAVVTLWTPHSTVYNRIQCSSHTMNTTNHSIYCCSFVYYSITLYPLHGQYSAEWNPYNWALKWLTLKEIVVSQNMPGVTVSFPQCSVLHQRRPLTAIFGVEILWVLR